MPYSSTVVVEHNVVFGIRTWAKGTKKMPITSFSKNFINKLNHPDLDKCFVALKSKFRKIKQKKLFYFN